MSVTVKIRNAFRGVIVDYEAEEMTKEEWKKVNDRAGTPRCVYCPDTGEAYYREFLCTTWNCSHISHAPASWIQFDPATGKHLKYIKCYHKF